MENKEVKQRKIDPFTTIVPFACILALCAYFVLMPENSTNALSVIRGFLGDKMGSYYLIIGLGVFLLSLWLAFSKIGQITIGKPGEKPKYGFWSWGAMNFTCGLASDILFYSFCEWIYYYEEPHVIGMGDINEWSATFPLYHWSLIPWSFYAVLAACFGFMLHVRGCHKQKYSEACRPLLGKHTDGPLGKIIDVLAVVALIAGTATTFSIATPLLSLVLTNLFGIAGSKYVTIGILVVVCAIYTTSVMNGLKGINMLSKICMCLFGFLLAYVFLLGGEARFSFESGVTSLGSMFQNFIGLSTWTDATRTEAGFAQNWTIFYWAYWMVWCVAAPFFMGSISRGRTVKQVIMGSYLFGTASTIISFIILGNYGLGMKVHGKFDAVAQYHANGDDLYQTIIDIIHQLPLSTVFLVVLAVAMLAFYATSFDSITMVASNYSYKNMENDEDASPKMKLFWAILLIMLPIALIFSEGTMNNLQTVSIIAAFPIGIVIILIIASFIKDAKRYASEIDKK
ncbi:betaine/carnitine transporter, BCCT family [Ruminococcaceae bacterium YRB3002]|nr:betaine/carnitine transporter, BCCT family [Ruminococcaceae bacterium YRB3002]